MIHAGLDGVTARNPPAVVKLSPMHPAIAKHRSGISAICQRYRISKLEVFGSAARAVDFDPASSDADFLVEFAPDAMPGLNSFFGAKADLEHLLFVELLVIRAGCR